MKTYYQRSTKHAEEEVGDYQLSIDNIVLKDCKKRKLDWIQLFNEENTREVDENGYTYLGILKLDDMKEKKLKNKVISEHRRRLTSLKHLSLKFAKRHKGVNSKGRETKDFLY